MSVRLGKQADLVRKVEERLRKEAIIDLLVEREFLARREEWQREPAGQELEAVKADLKELQGHMEQILKKHDYFEYCFRMIAPDKLGVSEPEIGPFVVPDKMAELEKEIRRLKMESDQKLKQREDELDAEYKIKLAKYEAQNTVLNRELDKLRGRQSRRGQDFDAVPTTPKLARRPRNAYTPGPGP